VTNAPELETSGPVRGMIGGHGPAIRPDSRLVCAVEPGPVAPAWPPSAVHPTYRGCPLNRIKRVREPRAPQASRVLHRRGSWLGLCLDLRAVNVANPFTKRAVCEPNRIPVFLDADGIQYSPPRGHRDGAHAQDFRPHVNRRLGNDDLDFLHCRVNGVRRTGVLRFRAFFCCCLNRARRCRLPASARFTGRRLDNRDLRVGCGKWIARWLGATASNSSRGGPKGRGEKTLHGWPVYAEESTSVTFCFQAFLAEDGS
jgi:hypothetical protein